MKTRIVVLGLLLFVASPLAAGQGPMDLRLSYDALSDSVLVEWFPAYPETARFIVVQAYGENGDLVGSVACLPTETCLVWPDALEHGIVACQVVSVGEAGGLIEQSPRERVPSVDEPALSTVRAAGVDGPKTEGLGIEFVDIAAQNFPYIYLTAQVMQDGRPTNAPAPDDFEIYEDGILQTDQFQVAVPKESGGVRLADIVFLIDTSGSMGGEIAAVRDNCVTFADALAASEIDYRLGLVEFGHSGKDNPGVIGGGLTADPNLFKQWVSTLTASGSYEPGFEAIRMAIQDYDFRTGAHKVFLIITDEDSDDHNTADTIDLILANNVVVHAAVDCNDGASGPDYCGAGSVREVSGGLLFSVEDDYTAILDEIAETIANTYKLSYRTTNDVLDGVEREVKCTVFDGPNQVDSDYFICCYTPGAAPKIERTPETLALHEHGVTAGTVVTISACVTDAEAPFVQEVKLYVRPTNTANYIEIAMVPVGNDIYTADISAALVQPPGVDYYLRATDGVVTSSDPSVDRDSKPYQLAVLPNNAPVIEHTPAPYWLPTKDVAIHLVAHDTTDSVCAISVSYRREGELRWHEVCVTEGLGVCDVTASVTLPTQTWQACNIEYFIKVTDDANVASVWPVGGADQPHLLQSRTFGLDISSVPGGTVVTPGVGAFFYDEATEVPVEAVPGECYRFVEWTGTAVEAGKVADAGAASTIVVVDDAYTLIPVFELLSYCVTISAPEGGTVLEPGVGVFCYGCGETVTIKVQPDPNRHFAGWPEGLVGVVDASDPNVTTITITINSDLEITPQFPANSLHAGSSSGDSGGSGGSTDSGQTPGPGGTEGPGGSITYPDGEPHAFNRDEPVHILAQPDPCYHFIGWSGTAVDAGKVADVNVPDTTVIVDADYTLIANFALNDVHLTLTADVGGSAVASGDGSLDYSCGDCVTVEARPDPCYIFSHWSGTAVTQGKVGDANDPNIVVCLDADYSLEAHFVRPVCTLTITSGAGGSVVTPGVGDFNHPCGESVAVEAVPQAHRAFAGWSGTAVEAGKVAEPAAAKTTVTVDGDCTLHANFEMEQHVLVVSQSEGGDVYIIATGDDFLHQCFNGPTLHFDHGTKIVLMALPKPGYVFRNFVSWSGSFYGTTPCWEFSLEDDWYLRAVFVAVP